MYNRKLIEIKNKNKIIGNNNFNQVWESKVKNSTTRIDYNKIQSK